LAVNERRVRNPCQIGQSITDYVKECAVGRKPRTLYVFANPLGNAVGDTAIATQHVSFLEEIKGNEITVWTTNGEYRDLVFVPSARCLDMRFAFRLILSFWTGLISVQTSGNFWKEVQRLCYSGKVEI
jgi:hypothetical protein